MHPFLSTAAAPLAQHPEVHEHGLLSANQKNVILLNKIVLCFHIKVWTHISHSDCYRYTISLITAETRLCVWSVSPGVFDLLKRHAGDSRNMDREVRLIRKHRTDVFINIVRADLNTIALFRLLMLLGGKNSQISMLLLSNTFDSLNW